MTKRKIFAGFAASVLAASLLSVTASAQSVPVITPAGVGINYTALTGVTNTTNFDKYLVMKSDASVPSGTLTMTIAPIDADIPAGTDLMPILKGVSGIKFTKSDDTIALSSSDTVATMTFASTDTTTAEATARAVTSDNIFWTTTDTTDEIVDIKTLGIDISGCTFTEPGIYRYTITESGSISGVTNDVSKSTSVRYLDIYIVDNAGVLEFNSFVIHTTSASTGRNVDANDDEAFDTSKTLSAETSGGTADEKSTGITNRYSTQNLEFGKEVIGNQGSKDKRFAVTVTTTNANANTIYRLDGNWTKEIGTATNATTYTAADMTTANNVTSLTGAQLNAGYTFYLCDGEYVKVKGLEVNGTTPVTYAISEAAEDYTSTATIAASVAQYGTIAHTDAVSGNIIADKDVYTGFVNERTGAIPTGVILSVAGPAVVGIGAVGLLITLNAKKRREDQEE